jgi:chemotaxis methyl-accepting protein methylase
VLDFLRPEGAAGGRLDIVLLACSNGAEAYTIAAWLRRHRPGLDFRVRASDLHPEMVARARAARYSPAEVLHGRFVARGFVRDTFVEEDGAFVVRPEIRARVEVTQADLLDGPGLLKRFGPAPLVVAQNVLFHMPDPVAERAFAALVRLMAPRAALMVAGMNLDLRTRLTAEAGLAPFPQDVRRIHAEGRAHTPPHWWRVPWGAEPFLPFRNDKVRRYATVFRRG